MRLHRISSAVLALLLAVILPMSSYSTVAGCAPQLERPQLERPQLDLTRVTGVEAPVRAPAEAHCSHHSAALHSHLCGACCGVAASASVAIVWHIPRPTAATAKSVSLWPPPAVTTDRLDRPPRTRLV